jgi:hypothetical protein
VCISASRRVDGLSELSSQLKKNVRNYHWSWNIVLFQFLRSCHRISPGPRRFETFRNNKKFLRCGVVAPRPTPKLQDHTLSAVRDCLFNIFAENSETLLEASRDIGL